MKIFSLPYFVFLLYFSALSAVFAQDSLSDSLQVIDTAEVADSLIIEEELKVYKIGDIADGNRSVPVHLIKLYDHNGLSIHQTDEYIQPFSTRTTCGDCHTYEYIKEGTHFSIDKKDSLSRIAEPYLYTDYRSLTLLPLSYRGWEGTFSPDSIGISPFEFVKKFGSHFTGGNISENEQFETEKNYFRWQVSGKLEINCLVCHDSSPEYDQADFAKQVANENLKWAAAGASGLSNVSGYASKMPDNFDPYNTNTYADIDLRTTPPPTIKYDISKFDENNKVFFDIEKRIDNESCRFCHTTAINNSSDRFLHDQEDVHISAGLLCVDCHKNGIDHKIIAGYSDEHIDRGNDLLGAFSCEGCHLGTDNNFVSGKLGAPFPQHDGIPLIHFEKLSCTVCHSSYWPQVNPKLVKTSRSHKLGVPGPNKMTGTFPHIQSPVFVRSGKGKIEPRNLVWPSYWGIKDSSGIKPLDISFVKENISPLLNLDTVYNFGEWPKLDDSTLVQILDTLKNQVNAAGTMVFVTGGRIYSIDQNKTLDWEDMNGGGFYSWPVAHNVRPAQQSLGINGCDDCHSLNSNFYFGEVSAVSSFPSSDMKISMVSFQGLNKYYESIFSLSFYFRPALKLLLIISLLVISIIFASYLLSGVKSAAEYFSNHGQDQK